MARQLKRFLLGMLLGVSIAVFYLGVELLKNTPILASQTITHTLTNRSPKFQPFGAVRMGVVDKGDQNQDNWNQGLSLYNDDAVDDTVAKELSQKVRVLVWVMTSPKNLNTKAQAIKETWGKRCNVIIFFSSETNSNFPTVNLEVPEGREHLTGKTMAAFRYIYENHFDDADWFMKADDDTYVIAENLRFFLQNKNSSEATYYGHLFKVNVQQGYYSGGSGYVISKEALRRFGKKAVKSTLCREDGGDEDVEFGLCMQELGVKTSMSVDEMGRSVFHPLHPQVHILGNLPPWIHRYTAGTAGRGFGVSKYAVSFHYVPPDDMRTLDFYMYHLRPYGIHSTIQKCNPGKDREPPWL